MKKLLLLSVIVLGLSMASCTQDGLGHDTEMAPAADDTGGMTGNTNTPPPPPPPPTRP